MTRDETVALFLQGREAWNAWANEMLSERKTMEADGRWAAETAAAGNLAPKNAETRSWMDAARADFARCLFGPHSPPQKKETEAEENDRNGGAEPSVKSMLIDAGKIDFRGFIFPGDTDFVGTTFTGRADFGSTAFRRNANFLSATFCGHADFGSTTFTGHADFLSATFTRDARFGGATFRGAARFRSVIFLGDASFENATFRANATFGSTAFGNYTTFAGARFLKEASLIGLKVERALNLKGAKFAQVPAFNQSDFKQAPFLDEVSFPIPGFFRMGKAELISQYRAIRRMAIQGTDYEREHMALKGELRSRRWTTDKWWYPSLWLGIFYDGAADCGRSIVRPLAIWFASVFVFAVLYIRTADQAEGWSCGAPFIKALFLSGRNALVLFSGSGDARITQAYHCLFGGDFEPKIPDGVSYLESFVQVPLSATLIFLFLLALKNRLSVVTSCAKLFQLAILAILGKSRQLWLHKSQPGCPCRCTSYSRLDTLNPDLAFPAPADFERCRCRRSPSGLDWWGVNRVGRSPHCDTHYA